ncbi:acetate--CoA ligase family protein [archaeon]|nr:acetate--CoA ligase family protein [archaeon]
MPLLSFNETKKLLGKYRIELLESLLVKNPAELEKALRKGKLKFPLALKVQSKDIIHKTEAKGVKLGVKNEKEALQAFKEIIENAKVFNPKARIQGVLVQEMKQGKEVIIGGKIDETFGPIILFGSGGILVELLHDSSIRICPINKTEAGEMIKEIKGFKLLNGFRGEPQVNFKALEELLLSTSNLLMHEKIKELDFNPVIVNEKNAWIADARVIE